MEIEENHWKSMEMVEIYGNHRKPLKINGKQWMGISEKQWKTMEINGFQ